MLILATFENSIFIELAISELEVMGVPKGNIFAVPLDKRREKRKIFDTIHRADGISMLDASAILGTCFMLLGAIYGFVLDWGPIIWGIIGAVFGIILGLVIKLLLVKKNRHGTKKVTSEVVMMVRCEEKKGEEIVHILWDHNALGVSSIKQ